MAPRSDLRTPALTRRSALRSGAAALFGLAAAPLLAACGGAASATTGASTAPSAAGAATSAAAQAATTSSAQASAAASQAAAAPGSASGAVTWLVPEDPLIDKFAKEGIIPAFQKANPGITIQAITPGSTAYGEKLLTLVAAGTVPEVFTDWGGASFYTLWDHKLLTNLSPYFQKARVDTSYLLPVYVQEYTAQGNLYAVPWNSNPNFVVYNKTLFQKAGVPLPPSDWNDKSWNTDKLLQTAQALTKSTGNPATSTFGITIGAGTCGSLGWLWGADPFNDKGGPQDSTVYQGQPLTAVYPDRQGMVDAMTWLADLTNKYHVSPSPTDAKAMSAQGNPIFSGRLGMAAVAGGWLERQAAVAQPKFEWAIAPFPYGPGGQHTPQREDNAWYIGNGSKNTDAGFSLILYATRGAGADDLISYAKDNPPLADTSYLSKWADGVLKISGFGMTKDEFTSVFEGGIKAGFGDPTNLVDNASQYSDAFSQSMDAVWIGKQSPLAGLQAVKQKWEGIIKSAPK